MGMKVKKITTWLTEIDAIDITIFYEKKNIIRFAINYRGMINGRWREIYRVDNYHGFLHEQKFWWSNKPLPIQTTIPTDLIIKRYLAQIKEEFIKYRMYVEQRK